jgi:hypothetical protein
MFFQAANFNRNVARWNVLNVTDFGSAWLSAGALSQLVDKPEFAAWVWTDRPTAPTEVRGVRAHHHSLDAHQLFSFVRYRGGGHSAHAHIEAGMVGHGANAGFGERFGNFLRPLGIIDHRITEPCLKQVEVMPWSERATPIENNCLNCH